MSSPVLRLPLELLEKIVLDLHDDPTSPPYRFLPLLLTSKHFYASLSFKSNNRLYARMFRICFDESAPARRLGDLNAAGLCIQLRVNYDALKCIRRRDIHADNILQTFWTCFLMMMENDGKNRCQLDAAGLFEFVDSFVRKRLYENSIDGWPAENEINSLAIWLLWLTSTEERLRAETPAQRVQMTRLVFPYVLMSVLYAIYSVPHIHYASVAAKLIYFSYREVFPIGIPPHLPKTRAHAFQLGLDIVRPTHEDIQELNEHKAVKFVPKSTWKWWNEIEDYDNLGPVALSKLAPSARWDDDWNRLADCNSVFTPVSLNRTHYTPGLLTGLWQGRMLYLDHALYENIMQTPQMPQIFSEQSIGIAIAPVFMRLREYHCMDVELNQPVPSGGIQNAWFNSSTRFQEVTHGLVITCQERDSYYDEYVVGGPDLHDESRCRGCQYRGTSETIFREDDMRYLGVLDDVLADEGMEDVEDDEDDVMDMAPSDGNELVITRNCDGILDIILVGETDLRHGQAWHHYKFYGRVREWDGLVALIRVPTHSTSAALGVCIFTGYVVGGQNFVGNWRTTALSGELESAFTMSKRE
ncbi:hypothetical protein J3R83DRAFT_3134 [Lanmaoa asiatica]|nr:hypothetical protein J3R83DRAFT_3134 [Lanmaoa asiatica]